MRSGRMVSGASGSQLQPSGLGEVILNGCVHTCSGPIAYFTARMIPAGGLMESPGPLRLQPHSGPARYNGPVDHGVPV